VQISSQAAGTLLNLTVTAAPSSASVSVPIVQEVPFPDAFIMVNH
jgi:hypothetical protein